MPIQQQYNWYQHLQQLQGMARYQEQRISQLENTMGDLSRSVEELRQNQQPVTVNYSFDQLKIDTLEGTLNIGLNPNKDLEDLNDFTINDQAIHTPSPVPNEDNFGVMNDVTGHLNHYFGEQAHHDLRKVEEEKNVPLDDAYREFIMKDIQGQLQPRIEHYVTQNHQKYRNQEELTTVVTQKVQEDIKRAFRMFIDYLPKKRRDET